MSLGESRIPEEDAKTEAEYVLRLNIGNLPHLGKSNFEDDEYVFDILISLPKVIFDKQGQQPVDIRFLEEKKLLLVATS